jgi:thioredoxin reductase (NADPH)
MKMEKNMYDILTIGAGPAGLTAGIYGVRANMKVGMIERSAPGGQIVWTYEIENYPGYEKLPGPDLAMKMYEHATNMGAEYLYGDVVSIEKKDDIFVVKTEDSEFKTKTIIITTGTVNRRLGVAGEDRLAGYGISWCAICDGAFYKGKEVAVIGGGNSALEEALYLASIVDKVYVIHRRDAFRGDKLAQERVFSNKKIEVIWDTVVEAFNGEKNVESITIKNIQTNETKDLKVSGVFLYIGQDPATQFVKEFGILDESNYVIANQRMETAIPGLFAAGDCIVKDLRQVATAVSDGAVAAIEAIKYIERQK